MAPRFDEDIRHGLRLHGGKGWAALHVCRAGRRRQSIHWLDNADWTRFRPLLKQRLRRFDRSSSRCGDVRPWHETRNIPGDVGIFLDENELFPDAFVPASSGKGTIPQWIASILDAIESFTPENGSIRGEIGRAHV